MTDETDIVPLLVTPGPALNDGYLVLRFPPEHEEEILALLDEHGIAHDTALEHAAGPPEWIEAVHVIGTTVLSGSGVAALASVIKTFVHRHDHKRYRFERDGEVIEVAGVSEKYLERLIDDRVSRRPSGPRSSAVSCGRTPATTELQARSRSR